MENQQPTISIIVASYNAAASLPRCLDSIEAQTYPHKELIVMDGGSTDGTADIIKAHADRISYWESKPDRGIAHAWNKALKHCHGEWIYILGADDYLWEADVLEKAAPLLTAAYPEHKVVYGKVAVVDQERQLLEIIGKELPDGPRSYTKIMRHLSHQGVLIHRWTFETHGGFTESFSYCMDYEFLLRVLRIERASFLPDITLAGMQIGGLSNKFDLDTRRSILEENIRAIEKNGLKTPRHYKHWMLAKEMAKHAFFRTFGQKRTKGVIDLYRVLSGRPRMWTKAKDD